MNPLPDKVTQAGQTWVDLSLPLGADNPFSSAKPEIAKLGHMGTHIDLVDTPGLPLERMIAKTCLVDAPYTDSAEIDLPDLTPVAEQITPGDNVIFRTGWLAAHYPDKSYFKGHPQLSDQLIDFLLEKKVNMIGVDFPGIKAGSQHRQIDQYCLDRGVYILENLNNLALITQQQFTLYCFPLKLVSSGATARVVAQY
jgi:kynurenine formamidase